MHTLLAALIIALVFGVVTIGPFIIAIVGLAAAIWFVRALLIGYKESKNGTKEGNDYRGFAGGEHLTSKREQSVKSSQSRSDN